jgi:hypothetical protein
MTQILTNMKLKLLSPIGSVIAIFGFFSPWMSCGAIKFSGYDLASGADIGGDSTESDILIWLVLVAAAIITVLYFFFNMRRQLKKAMIPTIGAAVLGLSILAAKYIDVGKMKSGLNEGLEKEMSAAASDSTVTSSKEMEGFGKMMDDSIRIEWGFWLTALAFATSIAGAWNYKDEPLVLDVAALGTPLPDDGSKMNQDLGM